MERGRINQYYISSANSVVLLSRSGLEPGLKLKLDLGLEPGLQLELGLGLELGLEPGLGLD